MRLECSVVAINLIEEQLCIIVAGHQDFEQQGPRFILQRTNSVRSMTRCTSSPGGTLLSICFKKPRN
jgi:hypothetical protein